MKDSKADLAEGKQGMTSLDIRFLIKELKDNLTGGLFRKIYQYDRKEKEMLFDVFVPRKGGFLLYTDRSKIFLTKSKWPVEEEPSGFCMLLRKHLIGRKIKSVKQHGFDRIVEIHTEKDILILELFSKGNTILCDSSYKITLPMEIQSWKDREIRPKIQYKYPPGTLDPFEVHFDSVMSLIRKSDRSIVVLLAKDLGLGGPYATEICSKAGIETAKVSKDLSLQECSELSRILESVKALKPRPSVYPDMVSPFPLSGKGEQPRTYDRFSDALDDFFMGQKMQAMEKAAQKTEKAEAERMQRIETGQREAKDRLSGKAVEAKGMADLIYLHYTAVESVLNAIRGLRSSGYTWNEVKYEIRRLEPGPIVKEIRENEGKVILNLEGREITLDFRKSLEDNAGSYYEYSKKAKRKLQATIAAAGRVRKPAPKSGMTPLQEKNEWYSKFKWFFTSDGFLVIAGRSAEQNELLLKRYTDGNDPVFHADIPGSAFVVIKAEGRKATETAMKEAAEFAAANSKAWVKALGTADVYSVPMSQVTKTPPSGAYLPKGSFMITGRRTWFRNMEIKLSIGIKLENGRASLLSGPVMAMRKHSTYFVTIKPGVQTAAQLARDIKSHILLKSKPEDKKIIESVPLWWIERVIPAGTGEIID